MEHLIRFRTAEGIDGSHVSRSLDEAVTFVERLRNAEAATDVRLFRLTEVAIEFKPYYRVEVGGVDLGADTFPVTTPTEPLIPAAVPAVVGASHSAPPLEVPDAHASNGRRLFSRT